MVQVTQVSDERAEAETVVALMQQLHQQGRHKWKDMAILYSTNAQSRLFEEQLVSCAMQLQCGQTWLRLHALSSDDTEYQLAALQRSFPCNFDLPELTHKTCGTDSLHALTLSAACCMHVLSQTRL